MGLKKNIPKIFQKTKNFISNWTSPKHIRLLFQRANVYKFSDLIVVDKGFKQSCEIGLMILLENVMIFMIGTMGMWILNKWLGQVSLAYLSIVPCKKGTLEKKKKARKVTWKPLRLFKYFNIKCVDSKGFFFKILGTSHWVVIIMENFLIVHLKVSVIPW